MSRAIAALALFLAAGCSADPTPPMSSGTGEHEPAVGAPPAPPASSVAAASASPSSNRPAHEAKDPASLLGGGAALDALPTRSTETGGRIDPGLRQRLMAPPP